MTPDPKRLDRQYIALQASFWAMMSALCAYQAALLQSRGFSSGQIGLLVALRYLAGILLQPLIGGWADRHPQVPLKRLVNLSLSISLAACLLYAALPRMSFGLTAVIFCVFGGFETSAYPLMDSMAVQFIRAGVPIRYSLGRGMGSLAYAVSCVLLGLQVTRFGVEATLLTHAVLLAAVMVLVHRFPACQAPRTPSRTEAVQTHSALALMRANPSFTAMLFGLLFGLTAMLSLSNFLINILQDVGGNESQLGVALFLLAGSELPGSLLFTRLQRRGVASGRILVMSMFFGAVRALALLLAGSVGTVMLAQPLQMLGYGLFTPAAVYFVTESVPPADQVKGQALMMVFSNGLGGMLSGLVTGRTLELGQAAGAGARWMLLSVLACALAALALALLSQALARRQRD